MKPWKDWPYWGRGAAISVFICLLFVLYVTSIMPKYGYVTCGDSFCLSSMAGGIQSVFNLTLYPLLFSVASSTFLESPTVLYLTALLYYFFIGSFIGLMYGKVRYGKDTIHPPRAGAR